MDINVVSEARKAETGKADRNCASLHVPNPQPERGALIAATALVHRMTVVTRNVAEFRSSGVPVINP